MRAVPAVGVTKLASIRMVVDLPAPLGPRKPSTSPRATEKLTASTAVKLPNRLVRPSISISAASPGSPAGGNTATTRRCNPSAAG